MHLEVEENVDDETSFESKFRSSKKKKPHLKKNLWQRHNHPKAKKMRKRRYLESATDNTKSGCKFKIDLELIFSNKEDTFAFLFGGNEVLA